MNYSGWTAHEIVTVLQRYDAYAMMNGVPIKIKGPVCNESNGLLRYIPNTNSLTPFYICIDTISDLALPGGKVSSVVFPGVPIHGYTWRFTHELRTLERT